MSSSTFVPRRSARLAAKKGVLTFQPSRELLDAREQFLSRLGTEWTAFDLFGVPSTIKQYLNDIEEANGSNEKAKIATYLYRYMIRNPLILAVVPRFLETVSAKATYLHEELHKVTDADVRAGLVTVLKDFAYVVAPNHL